MEVSEGWQREGGVGDGVDRFDIAADVMRVAGLNATHINQSITTRSKKWGNAEKRGIYKCAKAGREIHILRREIFTISTYTVLPSISKKQLLGLNS